MMFNCPVYKRDELGYIKNRSIIKEQEKILSNDNINLSIVPFILQTTSYKLLKRNTNRKYLSIHNIDVAAVIYLSFGSEASVFGLVNIPIQPLERIVYDQKIPIDSVSIFSSVSGTTVLIGEG